MNKSGKNQTSKSNTESKNNTKQASKDKRPFFSLSFFLTSRSIKRGDKWTLALIALIMAVVFLNMLFTDAIFSGITKAMNDVKENFQYGEIMIEPAPGEDFISDVSAIKDFLGRYTEVTNVVPLLQQVAVFVNEKEKDGRDFETVAGVVEGIDPNSKYVFDLDKYILDGRSLRDNDTAKIMVGSSLAGGYGATVFPDDLGSIRPGDKLRVNMGRYSTEYEVVGTFQTKNFDVDRRAYVLKSELRRMLGTSPNHASAIVVRLSDKNTSKRIMRDLKEAGFGNLDIADWEEKLAFGAGISKSFEMIGMILQVIGALVAGLVIFIIIFVDVLNKRRQIGILKAIGITNKVIILDYVFRGLFYTTLGIIFGYILMLLAVEFFTAHPIRMPVADVIPFVRKAALLSSVGFFFTAGLIGSFVPSFKEIRKKVLTLLYR